MKLRLFGLCMGLLILSVAVACGGSSSDPATQPTGDAANNAGEGQGADGDAVAIVNNEPIARVEFEEQLARIQASYAQRGLPFPEGAELSQLRQQILHQLVQHTLVIQEAEARNITASDEEIQAGYLQTRGNFPDEATFKQAMEEEGLSQADLEGLIADNIKITKLLDAVVEDAGVPEPTEDELRELYDLASQQQTLPPFEEIEIQLAAELQNQRQNQIIQEFIQRLEAGSTVEVLMDL